MRTLPGPLIVLLSLGAACASQPPPAPGPVPPASAPASTSPAVAPPTASESLDPGPLPPLPPDPDFSSFVDPFIGTDHGGNVFPGPTLPWGLVKLGPDTTTLADNNAGYTAAGDIVGFSHLHVS